MEARPRSIAIALALVASALGPGCSNLVVKKVPNDERAMGEDDQKGFRYYLNRPYLLVKNPVLIFEKKSIVEFDPKKHEEVKFSAGERRNQTVKLDDLKVEGGREGTLRPVSAEELSRIRAVVASTAPRDSEVAQTSGDHIIASNDQGTVSVPTDDVILDAGIQSTGGGSAIASAGAANAADSTTTVDTFKLGTLSEPAKLTGDMEVVYLPDLDEQYAIKSKNWLAQTSFALTFSNGSQLDQVDGDHDATTVTIALLSAVQSAIGKASEVAQAQIQKSSSAQAGQKSTGASQAGGAGIAATDTGSKFYQMVERVYIRPGVYRLNKPWEITHPGGDPPTGLGLLAKLGLPTSSDIYFHPLSGN